MAPSRYDWKIVDWDVKPQHNQPTKLLFIVAETSKVWSRKVLLSLHDRRMNRYIDKMAELLLDSNIRLWVFLPIVIITFLVGIIRHYVTILLSSDKKTEMEQVKDR